MNRPMNTCKFSFMKYIRVMMLALLTFWCNGVMGQTFGDVQATQNREYSIRIENSPSSSLIAIAETNSGGELYTQLLTDLGKSESELKNGLYFRWYLIDRQGNYVTNSSSPFTQYAQNAGYSHKWTTNGDMYWCSIISDAVNGYGSTGWDNNLADNNGNKPKVLNAYYTPSRTVDSKWYDYQVVFVATSDLTGIVLENNNVKTEPTNFQVKYVFTFDDGYVPPIVDNFSNLPSDLEPTSITPSYTYSALTAQPAINVDLSAQRSEGVNYVRWYLTKDGSEVSTDGWALATDGVAYQTYQNSRYFYTVTANTGLLKLTVTPPAGVKLADYQLVCLVSDNDDATAVATDGTLDTDGEPLTTEPTIDAQYIISFEEIPFENVASISETKEQLENIYEALSPASASITLNDVTVPSYIRWYFADASGNAVANPGFTLSNEGYTYSSQGNSIYYGGTTTDVNAELLNMTVTPQSGKSWSDLTAYKLVALLSNEAGTVTDGTLTQEPLIATKYEISFDYVTFASELPNNQHTLDIEVTEADAQTVVIPLSAQWEQIKSDLGAETVTYMKYYWLDASDNVVSTASLSVNGISFTNHTLAGMHWLKLTDTSFSTDMLDFTASVTSGVITDYKLVILLSDEAATYDESSTWVKEPTLQSMYTVSFSVMSFENTVSATEYKTISIYDELTYENIPVDLGGEAPTYVRWYWSWSWDDINVAQTNWTFDNTAVTFSEYNGTKYFYAGVTPNDADLNQLTITPPAETAAKTLPSTNLKLVALVSTKTADDGAILDASSNLVKEPLIDKKYIISFASVPFEKSNSIYNATKKEDVIYVTNEQKNGNVSVTVELDENLPTILSTFYKNNATDLDAGFYLRWYIVDGSGNRVTDLTGWSLSSANNGINYTVNNYGHYWYSALNTSIKVSENQNLMNLVVKSPSGTDLTSYKAVCVMSANLNDATVIEGNLVSEPTWTLQYTYSFASLTFEGSTTGAQSLSETIRLEDDAMSSVTLSLPLSSVRDYMDNETSSFYIRYYLTDKTGNRVDLPTGVTITPKDITLTSSDYGHYWYSSTGIGSITDLGVSVADANGTVDLRNYNVVAVMSSNAPLQVETDGTVTYEPREMEVVYTFELKKPVDNSFDGACTGDIIYVTKKINEGETTITLTDVRDDWNSRCLGELFEPNSSYVTNLQVDGKKVPRYRRVYVRHRKTKESLNWVVHTDGEHFNVSDYGHIWTAKYDVEAYPYANYYCWFSPETSKFLTTTIKVPDGSSLNLLDVEVVFILAQGDAREEDTEDTWTITKGPEEHEVEYIFRFTDGVDRFSGTATVDAIEKSLPRAIEEDENGVYDKTAQLMLSDDMSDEYKAKLTGAETVYLRWYVTDKSGNILSPDVSPVSLILLESDKLHQTEYGYIWYSGYDGDRTFSTDLLNVTATASASVNLYDYNVVCVMTTDVSDATMEDEEFTKESSWEARYTYTFTRAFAGKLADDAKTIYKTLVVADDATSVNVPLSKRIDEIRSYFGMKSYDELNNNFHIRWALLDNDGNEVYTQGQLVNKDSNDKNHYYENDYGIYWNTKTNKNGFVMYSYNVSYLLDVTYTLSANTTWQDYKVVVYMTDDNEEADGVRMEAGSDGKPRLVHEPNHLELCYVIDFRTEDEMDRFVHYQGVTGDYFSDVNKRIVSDYQPTGGEYETKNVVFDSETGAYIETDKDVRQQTHEWTYEIYLDPEDAEESYQLTLPFDENDALEPVAYFRWYDWNTDSYSSTTENGYRLESGSLLSEKYLDGNGNSRGLFVVNMNEATATAISNQASNAEVGVKFAQPTTDWNECVIACDVSKYMDGLDLGETHLLYEPTLSYRYKFIIRPANYIADAIDNALAKGDVLENHGDVTIGVKDDGSEVALRLNLRDYEHYFFYDDAENLRRTNYIQWRVYDASGKYCAELNHDQIYTRCKISRKTLNACDFYAVDDFDTKDYSTAKYDINVNIGDAFYIVAFAAVRNQQSSIIAKKPIARFNCKFSENYPIEVNSLINSPEYQMRTINYLDNHYTRVGLISFDIEEGSTLDTPTYPLDNINDYPFKWNRSHYGYCYPQLYSYLAGNEVSAGGRYAGLSPLHGDYILLKTMNVPGISESESKDGYKKLWYQTHLKNSGDLAILRDHTYRYSAGAQSGYFLYVDASEESRPIANVAFEGEMCVGSTLVLSAMVADMTSGNEKPQLIFKLYGIKTDVDGNETERKLVHSFATCDFSTVGAGNYGVWYQVYAKVTLQNNSGADQYRHFIVSIDNYCANTNGADYAIDDIRIYAQNSKVEVKQKSVLCSGIGQKTRADIMIPHETLLAMMPTTGVSEYPLPVYYRICRENGDVVKGVYGNGGAGEYGQVDFRYYFYDAESSDENEKAIGEGETVEWLTHHYRKDAEGKRYFVVNEDGQEFALEAGQKYYVSLAVPKSGIPVDDEYEVDDYTWGSPQDPCSMYSEAFQPISQSVSLMVGTSGINRINVDCHLTQTTNEFSITGALQLPNSETGELVSIDNPALCSFDWIVENVDDATIFTNELKSALVSFRIEYGELLDADGNLQKTAEGNIIYHTTLPENRPADDAEGFNGKEYDLLKAAIDAGKLYIVGSSTLKGPVYKVGNTYRIISIPLEEEIVYHGTRYEVCPEPMEVTVEARLNGPELDLGFSDVDYEGVGLTYGAEGLRIGLNQLERMQKEQIPLHLPISKYKQLQVVEGKEEYVEYETYDLMLDEFDVIVWDSNDPTWASYLCKEKNLYDSETEIFCIGGEKSHEISNRNQSVELLLHSEFTKKELVAGQEYVGGAYYEGHWVIHTETSEKIKYHEGYWYKVKFRYSTREDAEGNPILGRCYGESYLTIKVVPEYATWGEGLPNNSNWLNDENWRRSSKAELYKEVVNSNNYPVYDESTGLSNDKGFVPMSFTNVTILGGMPTPYPYLSQLQTNKFTGLITEETLTNGDLSPATNLIQYDMMVTDKPGVCLYDETKTNVYECIPFYGNICKDIYFKPRAQLRNQHYLSYTKAWVDVELLPGQWTMMAAPLMKVHAGDFYVPAGDGRQETEAFLPIKFDATLNSRNAYPFYQRSWDKKVSKVVTTPDDIRSESETEGEHWYDAFVEYSPWAKGNVEVECLQWSHSYNDMQEHYEPGKGFAIRAHHKDDAPIPLIRLPKADDYYTYYNYKDEAAPENTVSIDTTKQHRLAVDGVATGMLAVPLTSNETEANGYYLVGNPYMARLDMELFFSYNPQLMKTYWVVTGNEVDFRPKEGATSLGIIGPMQSFFVKIAEGKSVSRVIFSPDMQASNLKLDVSKVSESDETETTRLTFTTRVTANAPMAQTRVVLSAEADNGFVDEEDVETLLDSNLEDVPMVYTVAGTQAAVVNRLSELKLLPVGIFGKKGTTETVTVNGVDGFAQPLYLYDTVTRLQTKLEEGSELSLMVGEHGRYFITDRAIGIPAENEAEAWIVCAYSLQQGRLVVAVMPDDRLGRVQVYAVNGTLVTDDVPAGNTVAEYALPAGTYIVVVETLKNGSSSHSLKVVVK
ncbi:MAG: hypothetical protein IJX44_02830 [Bacteroidaceae bacterium]|nr:hypothetical protein [Bacteroidaceae bacterium]